MKAQNSNRNIENQLTVFTKNEKHIKEILSFGFFRAKLLDDNAIEGISEIVKKFEQNEHNSTNYHGLVYSLFALNHEKSIDLNTQLSNIINPFLNHFFKSFKSVVFSYLRKESGFNTEFYLHQDWNYTNEQHFQTLTGWLALQDIEFNDGGMFFLEPNDRLNTLRSGSYLTLRLPSNSNIKGRLNQVSLKKGEIIFFQPSVFHGSAPNLGSKARRVVNFIVMPKNAPFLHYKKLNKFIAEEFLMNESDIFEHIESLAKGIIPKILNRNRYLLYNESLATKRIQKNLF